MTEVSKWPQPVLLGWFWVHLTPMQLLWDVLTAHFHSNDWNRPKGIFKDYFKLDMSF